MTENAILNDEILYPCSIFLVTPVLDLFQSSGIAIQVHPGHPSSRLSAFRAILGVSTVLQGRSNVALFEGSLSFDDAAAAFKNAMTPIVQQGVDVGLPAIKNGMEAAAPLVKQGFDAALPVMKQAFDASVPILKNGMEAAVPMVKQGVDAALPVMKQAFDASVEVATPVLMQAADSAGAAAGVAAAKAGELLRGSLDADQQVIFDSATRVSGQIGEVLGVTAKVGLEGVKMGVATVGKTAKSDERDERSRRGRRLAGSVFRCKVMWTCGVLRCVDVQVC